MNSYDLNCSRLGRSIFLFRLCLSLVLLAAFCLPVRTAAAAGPEEILKAIQDRYRDVAGLSADYTRTTRTPAMEGVFQTSATHTAAGLLLFSKPAKLVLNQSTPRTEKMVTDGSTVWWYIPDENVVHRYAKLDVYGELKPLLDFLNGLDSLSGRFTVKVTPAGTNNEDNHRLDLNRLQEGSGPAAITVWFKNETLDMAGFRLTSALGETTDFTLADVKINPALDDSLFVFRIPATAQIIEESGEQP